MVPTNTSENFSWYLVKIQITGLYSAGLCITQAHSLSTTNQRFAQRHNNFSVTETYSSIRHLYLLVRHFKSVTLHAYYSEMLAEYFKYIVDNDLTPGDRRHTQTQMEL